MTQAVFESPNDWVHKAGGRQNGLEFILPHKFLLVPMTVASEAILKFRAVEDLNSRIQYGIVVVTMIRIADTAFYNNVAKMIMSSSTNKKSGIVVCEHCLRGQLWPNRMKELRQAINKRIIHKMEDGLPINVDDLEFVEQYYGEIFKHPLTNPVSWPERKGLEFCPKHCPKK